jgi:hypothetical protein
MGDQTGICPKAFSYDHRCEEAIAWNTRWAKKKPFPVTIGVKKSSSSPDFGAKTSKIHPDPKTFSCLQIYLSVREDLKVQMSSQGKKF